mgnify:CR=1 FL=1
MALAVRDGVAVVAAVGTAATARPAAAVVEDTALGAMEAVIEVVAMAESEGALHAGAQDAAGFARLELLGVEAPAPAL